MDYAKTTSWQCTAYHMYWSTKSDIGIQVPDDANSMCASNDQKTLQRMDKGRTRTKSEEEETPRKRISLTIEQADC